jgi:hypothetical protein
MNNTPAPFIPYPQNQNCEARFFRVDTDKIDPILLRQKDSLYEMYNHMTNTNIPLGNRQILRQQAIDTLELLRPLWIMFDYEYKYHELFRMFDECTISL